VLLRVSLKIWLLRKYGVKDDPSVYPGDNIEDEVGETTNQEVIMVPPNRQ